MKLRVWWNRNGKQTVYHVSSIDEAKRVIERETTRDLRNPLIAWNASGLEVYEDGEWCEYYNEDGLDIKEIMDGEEDAI